MQVVHEFLKRHQKIFFYYSNKIDSFHKWLMNKICWCLLLTTIFTFSVAILRYVFKLGWVWMQDSSIYLNAVLVALSAAYTLFQNEHVRVDIFYKSRSLADKARLDIYAFLLLFLPLVMTIFLISLPYVSRSWLILEDSVNIGGLHGVFLVKTLIPLLALSLFLQGLSEIWKSYAVIYLSSVSKKAKNSLKVK